jgi:hypothetical protein
MKESGSMNKTILGKQMAAIFLVMTFLITAPRPVLAAAPAITITSLPPYGTENAAVKGKVSGVNFNTHYVTAYIQVNEVWWVKPTAVKPRCKIGPDGTFSCPIRSGGCDVYATAVVVQLLPNTIDPAICNPCKFLPKNAGAKASTIKYRPYLEKRVFSGYEWRVKKATKPGCRLGPGVNYFSDTAKDVWVDANKALHLRIRKVLDTWYSSEVVLHRPLGQNPPPGYGTYVFRTNSRLDIQDANLVLGMFTWDNKTRHPTHREMGIELARWGDPSEVTNAQFALQPCDQCPGCGNCSRFRVNLTNRNKYVTFYMIWSPGKVEFKAYRGRHGITPPAIPPIHAWTRTGLDVPAPGKASIRINFWLFRGLPPLNGTGAEVIIERFMFKPLAP